MTGLEVLRTWRESGGAMPGPHLDGTRFVVIEGRRDRCRGR